MDPVCNYFGLPCKRGAAVDLLRNSDGKDYVVIYVRDGRSVRRLGDNWTVRADESLLGALSEAFGADNVRLTQKKI